MYRKNTAGQFIGYQLLLTASGLPGTGVAPSVRRCIDGTFAAGTGTSTEDTGTGGFKYAMSQADTNGNDIQFWFTATGCIPVCINIVTTAADPTDSVRFGLTALPNAAASAVGGLPLSVDTSGRVDVLKINGTSQTARDIGASVLLSTGTGTGQLDFTAGVVKANVTQLLGTAWLTPAVAGTPDVNAKQFGGATVTATTSVTIPAAATLATTTNITSGTITTVTNLTNAPTSGDLTATMKTSVAAAVWQDTVAGDFTVAASVGKSVMNGVALGTGLTVASVSGAVGSVTGAVGSVTGNVGGNVTGSVGSVVGAVGSVSGAVGSVTGNVGGNVVGAVASVSGNVGGNVVGSVASVVGLTAANLDVAVSTRLASASYTAPLDAAGTRTAVGLASANLDTQLGTINTNVVAVGALVTGLNNISTTQVKTQVVAALATDTYAEPGQGSPAATTTLAAKINYLYKNWRNQKKQTSSGGTLYADDAVTVDQKFTVADDGTTATRGEITSGP